MNRFAILLTAIVCAAPLCARPASPPNIILILADDLGYGDLGSYGQKRIRTPNLDRLAQEGIRFTQAYSGSTVCAPSRSVLMTGQHAGHTRVRGNSEGLAQALRPGDVTVAEVLRKAGYRTALVGKWGLGDVGKAEPGLPRKQGFDQFFGYLNQRHAHNPYPSFLWRNEGQVRLANLVPNEDAVGSGVSSNRAEYAPDLFLEEALQFIRARQDSPFFLYFATTIPHSNNAANPNGQEVPELGEYADRDWPEVEKGFAAMVTRLDRDIGRIVDELKQRNLEENTLLLFVSDNGPHNEGGHKAAFFDSNGPLRGIKRDLTEGGIRIPAIARWPGQIPAGTVSDAVWYFADVLPTAAALADTPAPSDLDGVDISPTLFGKEQPPLQDRFLYWEFHERGFQQAARRGPWKALRLRPDAPLELYRLDQDLEEQNNLAQEHPEIVREFESHLGSARSDSPDWPVKSPSR